MSDLANYSIETDQVVLLSFKDGRHLRVPLKHLSHYLKSSDLEKIKKAVNLRRHFLRIHMPRLFVVLAAVGGLVALLSLGGKTIAGLFDHRASPQVTPHHTGIARSRLEPTPQLSSKPMPPAQRDVRLTAAKRKTTSTQVSSLLPATTPAPVPVASTPLPLVDQTAGPTPAPSASPSPMPSTSPQPTPSPLSTAQSVQSQTQSQVLGDSTASNPGSATP